jgi:hypothetical protein
MCRVAIETPHGRGDYFVPVGKELAANELFDPAERLGMVIASRRSRRA